MLQRKLLLIILLGLILRIGYALAIYEPTLLSYHKGDYDLYRILAEELLRGDLTFQNSGYLVRPPLFPMLAAALNLEPLLIISVNILLATGIIPVTYLLATRLDLPERLSLVPALIVALDPTSVKYSAVLLPEPLANLCLALSFLTLLKLRGAGKRFSTMSLGFMSGGFIVASALTRPAAYLLWLPMALWACFARRTVARGGGSFLPLPQLFCRPCSVSGFGCSTMSFTKIMAALPPLAHTICSITGRRPYCIRRAGRRLMRSIPNWRGG